MVFENKRVLLRDVVAGLGATIVGAKIWKKYRGRSTASSSSNLDRCRNLHQDDKLKLVGQEGKQFLLAAAQQRARVSLHLLRSGAATKATCPLSECWNKAITVSPTLQATA